MRVMKALGFTPSTREGGKKEKRKDTYKLPLRVLPDIAPDIALC